MAGELAGYDLDDLRRVIARIAGEAAGFLRDRLGATEFLHVEAVHARDETMRIDSRTEDFILDLLRAEGIRGVVASEEKGRVKLGDDRLVVVVDPLDGSKNFASYVPWAAVSIAVAPLPESGAPLLTDVVAGAVAPVFNWPVISFARGRGVYEGSARPIATPTRRLLLYYAETVEQARIIVGLINAFRERGYRVSARALGSASLESTWAGLGRALVFADVRGKLRTIDIAASVHIALEAGANVIVEKWGARIDRVEEVGVVIVAPPDMWSIVRGALCEAGLCGLVEANLLRRDSLNPLEGRA